MTSLLRYVFLIVASILFTSAVEVFLVRSRTFVLELIGKLSGSIPESTSSVKNPYGFGMSKNSYLISPLVFKSQRAYPCPSKDSPKFC